MAQPAGMVYANFGDAMCSPIVLYNKSVFMLGIETILRQNPALEIVWKDVSDAPAQLLALKPALIIFDRLATAPDVLLPLLLEQPSLVLLGVDADSSQVMVLTGERSNVQDGQDLAHLIETCLSQTIPAVWAKPVPGSNPQKEEHDDHQK